MACARLPLLGTLVLASALLLAAGCGGPGGAGFGDPLGSVDVANQTAFDDVTYFSLAPAGTLGGTGDLLGPPLFPGEVAYVGDFLEDYYDVDYDLNGFLSFTDFDYWIAGGFTNTYDVF